MRRTGNLFALFCSEAALLAAYREASRQKRSHRAAFNFARNLGANIADLVRELTDGTYRPHECNRFWVKDGRKPRLIEAPAFRDLVVQRAIYTAIAPSLERRYIGTTFACRTGLGTHKAADWLQAAMRRAPRTAWVLHVDVRKFFYSIDRDTLAALLDRSIKCQRTLDLLALFAQRPDPTGVPIGNLLSQTFANVYLSSLDHYCKRMLKIKDYGRYMDDSIMIAPNRSVGLEWLAKIESHLAALGLEISHFSLQPIKRGANFVGFRTWASARFVRPYVIKAFRRDVKNNRLASAISRLGHAIRTCSFQPLLNHLKENNRALFNRLPESHRRRYHAHARAA